MKPDLYTKAVLTVIAVMLAVIAFRTVINPEMTASAQEAFGGVQFSGANGGHAFFDTRTGEVFQYAFPSGKLIYRQKLTKLGQDLTKEPVK